MHLVFVILTVMAALSLETRARVETCCEAFLTASLMASVRASSPGVGVHLSRIAVIQEFLLRLSFAGGGYPLGFCVEFQLQHLELS